MREVLLLIYEGKTLREFPFGDRALEVGRSRYCDIVVHDPDLADRAFLVERDRDAVVAIDLEGSRRRVRLEVGECLPLGRHHELQRVRSVAPAPPRIGRTEPLATVAPIDVPLALVVGRGSETRHVRLDGRPLTIGSDPARNDLVLSDRAVSSVHCRIQPMGDRALVRDLGSRNGTWIDGRRVHALEVGPGARVRVGRTDLRLVAPSEPAALVIESLPMRAVMDDVKRIGALPRFQVLVTGESGSGKEGIARALHAASSRSNGPFVAYNGAGFAQQMVSSQLFGHERGAFTGAEAAHRGAFEQADGGTLFLDEVAELPLTTQARLLRVLETWQVRRLGSERLRKVDVRLVTATHRDLHEEVRTGRFRADLFYRLNVHQVHVPPLRDRPADVGPLARRFLEEVARDLGAPKQLTPEALERLQRHSFPGNVRELRNLVIQAAVHAPTEWIPRAEIVRALERTSGVVCLEDRAANELVQTVQRHQGNLSAAARALGIPRSTLRDRLRRIAR